uniref:Uncharacterized protein n=1 Tax=Arundo donax TaxID=35708 RepID=A0A0A9HD70_ARUDO
MKCMQFILCYMRKGRK